MKILQVNKYHYPRGGADRYYLDLGERLEAAGHEVAYFAMDHPRNLKTPWSKYFVSRVSYNEQVWKYALKIPSRTLYSLEAKKKFKLLLRDFKPDVIHIHNIYHQLSPSILDVATNAKIPVVMHLHDYKLVCPNHALFVGGKVCEKCLSGSYNNCIKQRCVKDSLAASILAAAEMYLHHKVLKIYANNISLFVAPSLFLKNLLIKAGWPAEKIEVINNAFSTGLPLPLNTEREDYFLYYGRLSEEKGVDVIIRAISKNKDLKLKIAGSGPADIALQTLGAEAARNGQLDFLGWREGRALSTLISQAKAAIIPSRWYENFPLTALEALSFGTPIIASNIGGLPEIVNSLNGCLVPPDDVNALEQAMADVLHGHKTWNEEDIRNSARGYTPELNTDRVIQVYDKLVKINK